MFRTYAAVPTVGVTAAAAGMAWAVRGRSSSVFGESVWRGDPHGNSLALTFDDGPSPGTLELLRVLAEYDVRATFFQCGENVLRHPDIAREVLAAGHEIANHSHTHPNFALRSPNFIEHEFRTAQEAIVNTTGHTPTLLRAPYGVRWFGFRHMQRALGLTGVMWSVIGLDWKLNAEAIAGRVLTHARGGDIICLHDGRATARNPQIGPTVEAVRRIVPELIRRRYHFETASQLICRPTPQRTT